MLKDFLCGLSYIFRGCRAFYGDRGAWKYALGALFLLLLFYSAMFSGCIYLAKTISAHLQNISLPAWLSWMSGCINGISLGLLVIIFLLLLVVTFKSFFEIAAEFFFDRMLAYYEKKKFGLEPVPQSISQQFKQTAGGLSDAIKTLILSLFMLLLSLVLPFIGQILFVVILGTRRGCLICTPRHSTAV